MTMPSEQQEALRSLDRLLDLLTRELAPGDIRAGWSDELRKHWRTWLLHIRREVEKGARSDVELEVGLAHNGILGPFDRTETPLSWHVSKAAEALYKWRGSS